LQAASHKRVKVVIRAPGRAKITLSLWRFIKADKRVLCHMSSRDFPRLNGQIF